jgi:hypothetical protein
MTDDFVSGTDGDGLTERLSALEARAPGRDKPPALPVGGPRRRWGVSLAAAAVLALLIAGTVGAGVIVVDQQAAAAPGIENPGQPLYGADLECMSPPQAAAYLDAHGYHRVVWQVEAGDPSLGKTDATSVQQSTPPEHGYVVPGAVLGDGKLHMVVDQRVGATGVGACFGRPMP